jgi:ApeA N-terminal domain 1
MVSKDIEIGREYFCREIASGREGRFSISKDYIKATLFAFDERFHLDTGGVVVLRTETNKIVSLHQNIDGGSGGGGFVNSDPPMFSDAHTIISNIAVVGFSAWEAQDTLRQVDFAVPHTSDLLRHSEKFQALADAEFGSDTDQDLLTLHSGGMTVRIWYGASGSMDFSRPQHIEPQVALEFDDGQTLISYINHVYCVVRFFSAALCQRLQPKDIIVRQLSREAWIAAVEAKQHRGDHSIWYIWPENEEDDRDIWVGRSFVHMRDDAELESFSACLKAWIDRDSEWSNATNLMMTAFKLKNEISPDRLLTAFKWFEETPGTSVLPAIKPEDVDKIAAAASAKAAELGYDQVEKRIRGSLAVLKTESHDQRFARLIGEVRAVFGNEIVPDDLLDFLKKAVGFRGKAAHAHFEPESETEFQDFSRSIYAVECLSYLLMLKDLPINSEGLQRVRRSRPVAHFRLSSESQAS